MIIEASNGGRGLLRRTSGSIDLQRLDHGGRATGTGGAFVDSHPPQWSMRSKKRAEVKSGLIFENQRSKIYAFITRIASWYFLS